MNRLLNAAMVMSTLLCVATVVLWVRSYWVADEWNYMVRRRLVASTDQVDRSIAVEAGRLRFLYSSVHYDDAWMATIGDSPAGAGSAFYHATGKPMPIAESVNGPDVVMIRRFLGFEYGIHNPTPRTRDLAQGKWIAVPLWLIVFCTGWPSFRVWRRRRRMRRAVELGLCPSCGYEVRATRDCCPECGKPVAMPPV
jgi:hypothetical protein